MECPSVVLHQFSAPRQPSHPLLLLVKAGTLFCTLRNISLISEPVFDIYTPSQTGVWSMHHGRHYRIQKQFRLCRISFPSTWKSLNTPLTCKPWLYNLEYNVAWVVA